jgi:acyl-coenzyme A thioesterase PaaI-like protein
MDCLQERFSPNSICFGCGPNNPRGLHIRSFPRGDEVVSTWTPEPHHQSFAGVLNGGICGTLLDCHSGWAAMHHIMQARGLAHPPIVVTADFHVKLRKPTPTGGPIEILGRTVETSGDRLIVEATLSAGGVVTASCRGTFVEVREGHPAYDGW